MLPAMAVGHLPFLSSRRVRAAAAPGISLTHERPGVGYLLVKVQEAKAVIHI